jgi:macrolide-specific efflux system membrane fusion protein
MTAEVHIVVARAKRAMTIPSTALAQRDSDGTYPVQVVDSDGAISPRRVTIGLNNKLTAEVLSGLQEGEQVVVRKTKAEPARSQGQPGGPPAGF